MRYLSVCSGIEAATVAWHPLGWEAAAFSEIEAFPRAVLAHHYPEVPLHGDFTTIKGHEYGTVDLLVGGTPCQSFSVAGLRKGLDDPRGNLMLEYGALAKRLGAKWLVWENVPGVLSANGGRDFGTFLGMLAELGYGFAYRVLDAQYFGVAQRRRRVFVVGCLGNWRAAAAVLFERHGLQGHPAPSRKAGKGFTYDTAPCLTSSGRGVERAGETRGQDPVVAVAFGGNNQSGPIDVATARNACSSASGRLDFETETFLVQPTPIAFDSRQDPVSSMEVFGALGSSSPQAQAVAFAENSRGELRLEGGDGQRTGALSTGGGKPGQGMPVVAHAIQAGALRTNPDSGPDGVGVQADVAYTLEARSEVQCAQHGMAVRRLTPRECERLQGFPDDYTLIPIKVKKLEPVGAGPCVKQTVRATIVDEKGNMFSATNHCMTPQTTCPRADMPTGVGYELCRSVCNQPAHAEVNAIKLAGKRAAGATLYLEGHTYACDSCKAAAETAGIARIVIGPPPGNAADGPRYKALGNSMAVPVMAWIGSRIAEVDAIISHDHQKPKMVKEVA